jgi:pyruvate/2-oxoglutarate dehydrogenase complex dihydrolipoamide acyltransferase (E2) component
MRDSVERKAPPPSAADQSAGGGEGGASRDKSEGRAESTSSAGTMSIGEVLAVLKPEFSDITVSKIRFLEGAGLVRPDRSASGYRMFSEDDVARLRFVLRAQRDQYLPLRVIRQRLADLEAVGGLYAKGGPQPAGEGPDAVADAGAPSAAGATTPPGSAASASAPRRAADHSTPEAANSASGVLRAAPSDAQFTREELCRAAGATVEQLAELESFALVSPRGTGERGSWYNGDDLVLLRLARDLAAYGLEARHLRMYKTFAEREAALFEQVVAPLVRQRNPEARARARETLEALADLGSRMRNLALRSAAGGIVDGSR